MLFMARDIPHNMLTQDTKYVNYISRGDDNDDVTRVTE